MATVLMFNLSAQRQGAVRMLCARLKIRARAVEKEEYAQPVGALMGVTERVEAAYAGAELDGEMLVMAGFSDAQVNAFLAAFRSFRVPPVALKAILTPTNAQWDAPTLFAELKTEREAVLRGAQAEHD